MTIRLCLFLVLCFFISNGQSLYFIKYKNQVQDNEVNNSIGKLSSGLMSSGSFAKTDLKIKSLSNDNFIDDPSVKRIYKIKLSTPEQEKEFLNSLNSNPDIEYIEKSTTYKVDFIPNDSLISDQYAIEKINGYKAWDITQGDGEIIIAIIDTGIDYFHPDLKKNIFINDAEDINHNGKFDEGDLNGIDDDNNGYIDDVSGWDFTDRIFFPESSSAGDYRGRDNVPLDEHGHGTNVAGIIGAESNNISGISGTIPNCRILNLRAFDPGGYGEEDDVASAILYAVQMGAKVINMSFGDETYSNVLKDVLNYAYNQGVVLVASSGNSSSDAPHYPSGFSSVICVGATDQNDNVASFSNTGSTVDLTAPGVSVLTTEKSNGYGTKSGTSVSCPFVSAAAALILSEGNFSNEEVKQILKSTSDDIETAGWDTRSGAGRLNLYKAVTVTAASKIKFNYPQQDFSTDSSYLPVFATILSPYFKSYNLKIGAGYNPSDWEYLITGSEKQASNENILTIDLRNRADTVYTLSLEVEYISGRITEERLNFYIDHTAPNASLVNILPSFLNDSPTILVSLFSDDRSVTKMFFRKKNSQAFNEISLDGFSPNSNFVRVQHFGFIPVADVEEDTEYEIYFEITNLGGITTRLGNNGKYFDIKTDSKKNLKYFSGLSYSLPPGRLFGDPININGNDFIAMNPYDNSSEMNLYLFNGNSFDLKNKLQNRILKSEGDFNNNGKPDFLSLFTRNGYIDEIDDLSTFSFSGKLADSSGAFWPVLAADIDSDSKTEILSISNDSTITINEVQNDFSLKKEAELHNYSEKHFSDNKLNSPNIAFRKKNEKGTADIWAFDTDGDLFSFDVGGINSYSTGSLVETALDVSSGSISAGDVDGDSIEEIAVLFKSIENYDIAPFNYLLIFNLKNDSLNILAKKAFIDITSEISSGFQNTESAIKLADIDSDGDNEIIVFAFPEAYVFDYKNNELILTDVENNVTSKEIFAGDLNKNGVPEIAFPGNDKTYFKEFASGIKPAAPVLLSGYSETINKVKLDFVSNGLINYIYRSESADNGFSLLDSTVSKSYIDSSVVSDKYYYYYIKTSDPSFQDKYSENSTTLKVFSHKPVEFVSLSDIGNNYVVIKFDGPVSSGNISSQQFIADGSVNSSSVSLYSANSYIVNFNTLFEAGAHDIFFSSLRDFYNSPITDRTIKFDVTESSPDTKLFIEKYSIVNPYTIEIQFNMDVLENTLSDKTNYVFTPANPVSQLEYDQDNLKVVKIQSVNPVSSVGIDYILKLSGLVSTQITGSIPIEEGAGSYIVINTNSDNLDNVYVYPSPARYNSGKLTFANLTRNAEIRIYDLHGKNIININETDGNGGIEWDMRDMTGKSVSSGIYIYFVRSLNGEGNVIEEKTEKFVVVK